MPRLPKPDQTATTTPDGAQTVRPAKPDTPRNPVDAYVGARIRQRRKLVGMSLEKLGNALGLALQQVQKYERGVNRVGASRLFDIARVLGVDVAFFYEGMPEQPDPNAFAGLTALPPPEVAGRTVVSRPLARETQELVNTYARLANPRMRRKVFELIETMVQTSGGAAREAGGADAAAASGKERAHALAFPITMAFQPVVDLHSGQIDAYEALVRGPGGEPAATVMAEVTKENCSSFDQACRIKAIGLAAALGIDRRLHINFLPKAARDPEGCIRTTLAAAEEARFPLDRITLEMVGQEPSLDRLQDIVSEYRSHGFRIAIDDFSRGYGALGLLAELKPDVIKLNRDLVRDCDRDQKRRIIVAGMLEICRELEVKVVCQGVERMDEMKALRDVGARFMQGFYFGRPLLEAIAPDGEIAWP
jgi:EAL domain-containing protein (putative c-di-GMP-specific phosphodiesterase class I)/transcriptional regulator with XRE-family HTH domain